MRRQPPHRVVVLGRPVRVVWANPTRKLRRHERRNGEELDGLTVTTERGCSTIYLHPGMRRKGARYVWIVFAHELLHAIVDGASRRRLRGFVRPILKHHQIEKLAGPLGVFLERNWGA